MKGEEPKAELRLSEDPFAGRAVIYVEDCEGADDNERLTNALAQAKERGADVGIRRAPEGDWKRGQYLAIGGKVRWVEYEKYPTLDPREAVLKFLLAKAAGFEAMQDHEADMVAHYLKEAAAEIASGDHLTDARR